MAWGKVDDKLWGSPKWLASPLRARGLWVSGLSWCMDQLTDGFVPCHVLTTIGGTPKDARVLIDVGLWESVDGGYLFHDWLDYQPSRASVLAERAAAAERQKKARDKAREKVKESRDSHGVTHGVTLPVVTVPPTRPDPTRPSVGLLRVVGDGEDLSSSSPTYRASERR
jgi:hypothetical protein